MVERTHELAKANEHLKELDQLKSKFVSDVSHELSTPITSLSMYLELLASGRSEKREHYMSVLKIQAGRLRQLVEDILDLSRLELGQTKGVTMAPVNLNEIVEQVVIAHLPRAEEADLKLVFTPGADLPLIQGERNQLAQMVTNLVTNAINYTPAGHVLISTRLIPERDQVCLQVEDTGMGIEPEDLPHLFERFYRGQRVSQSDIPGSGLGLGILKEIVVLHKGEIEVESQVGKGSTFRVFLPLAKDMD